jgi:hypothetical protein
MAKQATGLFDYANRNTARAQNRTAGGTWSVPVSGRHGPTIDPSPLKSKTAPKGGAGGLESRQIPAAIQEAGPEAMSVEGGEASMEPQMVTETQQPIENRGGSARYMIQGGGPKIDLSFLVPERANKAFDPSKAIGGENLPFQESKGVGGFFRRMLGDESNQQNIAAQQAQGAEWRQDAKEQKTEERLLNRMREADKPTQSRFEATQASGRESEANRVAAENKRLELEGERLGLTKQQIQEAKEARIADQQTKRQEMLDRVTQNQTENDLQREALAQRLSVANYPHVVPGEKGSYSVVDPPTGNPLGNFSSGGLGMIKDAKGNMVPGTTQGKWNPYVTPAKVPANLGGGGTVNRADGSTLGGPLTTPTRSGISLGGALNEPSELPPGGGVRLGGALPAPMPQAAPAVVTQPRSATLADQLVNLPGMGAALDMGYYMTPERTARLEESKRQQQAESLKRTRAMQEQAYGDLGPSMY